MEAAAAATARPQTARELLTHGLSDFLSLSRELFDASARVGTGAEPRRAPADVVAALPWLASWEPLLRRAGENPASSHVERSPLEALIDQGVQVVDTLASATQRPVGELQAELFVLERDGRIRRLRDGSYRLV